MSLYRRFNEDAAVQQHSGGRQLHFVTAVNFQQTKSKETKRIVRSHATKYVRANQRKEAERSSGICIMLNSNLPRMEAQAENVVSTVNCLPNRCSENCCNKSQKFGHAGHSICFCNCPLTLSTLLSSSRRDPFQSLPAQGTKVDLTVHWCMLPQLPIVCFASERNT